MRLRKEEKLLVNLLNSAANVKHTVGDIQQGFSWNLFLKLSQHNFVWPIVYSNLKKLKVEVPKKVLEGLHELSLYSISRNILMKTELKDLVKLLNESEVDFILLKGFSIPDKEKIGISSRFMQDVDLLIEKKDFKKMIEILTRSGFHESEDWWDERYYDSKSFGKDVNNYKLMIELHYKLLQHKNPFKINIEELWLRSENMRIGEIEIKILSKEDLTIYLCLHLYKHSFYQGLRNLYELSKLIEDVDFNKLVKIARKYKMTTLLYFCLKLAKELFDAEVPNMVLVKLKRNPSKKQLFLLKILSKNLFKPKKEILYKIEHHLFQLIWPDKIGDKLLNLKISLKFLKHRVIRK
jgi:hypothetical protein